MFSLLSRLAGAAACIFRAGVMVLAKGRGEGREGQKKTLSGGTGFFREHSDRYQPQEPVAHEPELHPPPPPTGLAEVMEKPDLYPASIKSTLMEPQVLSSPWSTRKVRSLS